MKLLRKILLLLAGMIFIFGILIPGNNVKATGTVASGTCGSSVVWT